MASRQEIQQGMQKKMQLDKVNALGMMADLAKNNGSFTPDEAIRICRDTLGIAPKRARKLLAGLPESIASGEFLETTGCQIYPRRGPNGRQTYDLNPRLRFASRRGNIEPEVSPDAAKAYLNLVRKILFDEQS